MLCLVLMVRTVRRIAFRDFFEVPGEIEKKVYEYMVPESEVVNAAHIMNVPDFVPDVRNRYVIFGGKDQIATEFHYIDKTDGIPLTFSDSGRITFYVLNGSFINFDFNKQPLSQNFSGTSITNLNKCHKITMEYPVGFTIDFMTDGIIYATKAEGVINESKLYFPYGEEVRDFYIEEYLMEKKTRYDNVTITVNGLKEDIPFIINTVAIKEMGSIGEETL